MIHVMMHWTMHIMTHVMHVVEGKDKRCDMHVS